MSWEQNNVAGLEDFAMYGFALRIPENWRVEFNPKGTRGKGDVVFQSPKGNRIFISWGPLEEANKRFKTIEEQRDYGISTIRKTQGVRSVSVTEARESLLCGHKAVSARLAILAGGGLMRRKQSNKHMTVIYFYCPNKSRYYVVYSELNSPYEYSEFPKLFESVVGSLTCHATIGHPEKTTA
jgi:hypothetical protein